MSTKCHRVVDLATLFVLVPVLVVVSSACGGIEAAANPQGGARGISPFADKSVVEICGIPGCNCTETAKKWKSVNCTFGSNQKVELVPGSVPSTVMELSIIGGDVLSITSHTFLGMQALALVRVDGTKNFIIHEKGFINLSTNSLLFQVQSCDKFVLENNGFKNVKGSINAEISNCGQVTIKGLGFSRLLSGTFENISSLSLYENSFTFENQGNQSTQGLVTALTFTNTKIIEIPTGTFVSALALLHFNNCEIKSIQSKAFSPVLISELVIKGTNVSKMHRDALTEKILITKFLLVGSRIIMVETEAVQSAFTNISVMNNTITEIQTGAFTSNAANIIIANNKIRTAGSEAFKFSNLNTLSITNNVVSTAGKSFIHGSNIDQFQSFKFTNNQIHNTQAGSLDFVPTLLNLHPDGLFEENVFNQTCACLGMVEWLQELLGVKEVEFALNTSFCELTRVLANCYEIKERMINMANFTEMVCTEGDTLQCEVYSGPTKDLDTTAIMLFDEEEDNTNTNLFVGLFLGFLVVMAVSGTIVILLIKWGIWMKKKGYCVHFRDRLNQNERSFDDERDMVEHEPCTVEEYDDGADLEQLKVLLDRLKKEMESPDDDTRLGAEEQIRRLYEEFNATNNNRQEEETHLYEELGNLQGGKPKTPSPVKASPSPAKLVVGEYSEPTDAAVHVYSELKQAKIEEEEASRQASLRSNASSSKMALRPLPEKPKDNDHPTPGPSSKY